MTSKMSKAPLYPRSHILAASGVAALLSLALLVFPSREVEAKKTFINMGPEVASVNSMDRSTQRPALTDDESPFPTSLDASFNQNTEALTEQDDNDNASVTTAEQQPATPDTKIITAASGDTLSAIFAKAGLPASLLHELLNSSNEAKRLSRIKAGQEFEFKLSPEGRLQSLHSKLGKLESFEVTHGDNGFTFKHELAKPEARTTYARGVIDSSLFLAAKKAGVSHGLTLALSNIFAYDIDFAQDIRRGDEFELIYEEKVIDGKRVGYGNILAARFVNRGKTYTAVRYTNKQGATSYYTADGKSMRKAFIRTPVDFARISSRFNTGRRHPILNKIRAHKGVDYAAPRGTPIKAAGDGRVKLAGRKGGYGNTVIIQHGNSYQTLYAHMQGFAKGIQTGRTVKQGQIIGYIGTTGLSTGPHLHYEFQINGTHVDPLSQKLPMADPIAGTERQRFQQTSKPLMAKMDQEKASMLAMNQQR